MVDSWCSASLVLAVSANGLFTDDWRIPVWIGQVDLPYFHLRVAFPLPHVPVTFTVNRPKDYSEHPKTLGEHLRKRRAELGLFQRQVANQLGASEWSYLLWENDRREPTVGF